MRARTHVHEEAREGIGFSGAVVAGGCELHNMILNQTQVLRKSCKRSLQSLSCSLSSLYPKPVLSELWGLAFCCSGVYSVSCKYQCSSLTAGSSWCWLSLIPEGCGLPLLHFFHRVTLSAPKGNLKDVQWKSKGDSLSLARGCFPLRPSGARRALFCETCTPESADKSTHIYRTLTEFPGLCEELWGVHNI